MYRGGLDSLLAPIHRPNSDAWPENPEPPVAAPVDSDLTTGGVAKSAHQKDRQRSGGAAAVVQASTRPRTNAPNAAPTRTTTLPAPVVITPNTSQVRSCPGSIPGH
jgi:hypothetical protein